MASEARLQVEVHAHHEQRKICASRAKYRDGRKPRAVKVYTINLESRYLLVQGVPAIGIMKELVELFALYGTIEEYNALDEYPAEEFTEVFRIKFQRVQSARVAKRKLDEHSFFGGVLHICYAPEFESVQETREKLQERRRYVARATSDKDWQAPKKKQETSENVGKVSAFLEPRVAHTPSYTPAVSHGDDLVPSFLPSRHGQEYDQTSPSASINIPSTDSVHHTSEPKDQSRTSVPIAGSRAQVTGARFMPRTTQLQERQRRREQSTALALTVPDTQEVVIGPKLPEIPKLDMDDLSLNTSAHLIREKLKEVSTSSTVTTSETSSDNTQSPPPVKQRRRI